MNRGDSVLFSTGFLPDKDNFYQVLVSGDTWLLKRVKKVLMDEKQYGSAKTFRNVIPSAKYFVYQSDQLQDVKLNKKSITTTLLDEKQGEIKQFVNDRQLKLNEEGDLIEVIKYYNSL